MQKCAHNGYREKRWWIDTAWYQDENLGTKWKIQKSGKSRIVYGLVTKHDADASTDIHVERSAQSLVCCTVSHHPHTHAPWLKMFESSTSSTWSSSCASLLAFDSPFLFPALPHVPYLIPPVPEARGKPSQLRQREYGLHWRVLPLHRPVIIDKSQTSQGKTNVLNSIDCVPSNVQSSHQEGLLYVFEDNEAVIKIDH